MLFYCSKAQYLLEVFIMLEKLIGKTVEITVAFAVGLYSSGLCPVAYYGILQSVDDNYCLISASYRRTEYTSITQVAIFQNNPTEPFTGNVYIKKDFIITCIEYTK